MPIPQQMVPQTDFSAGQLNADLKRGDNPIVKSGARQLSNWRLLNSGRPQQRPGRRAQFVVGTPSRIDEVRVLPGVVYRLEFGGDGALRIRDSTGTVVAGNPGPLNWDSNSVDRIVWTLVRTSGKGSDVVICFDGAPPRIARFDGVATWTFPTFQFTGSPPLCPYFRIAAPGITILASGSSGAVSLTTSEAVWVPLHILVQVRIAGRRLTITSYVSPTVVNAIWLEDANPVQELTVTALAGYAGAGIGGFAVGDIVVGDTSNTQGEIVSINVGASKIYAQVLNTLSGFTQDEPLISSTGKAKISAITNVAPQPVLQWDEQLISAARGWPQSCSTDQGRLIFCDLPSIPEAIIWSAVNQTYNFDVGAQPTQAMVELLSGKPRIYHVIGGLQEVVFTDKGVYYIPINEVSPLKPGSVVFRLVTPDAASRVRPVDTNEAILYVNAGRNRIVAVIGSGAVASTRPYAVRDASEYHYDLFNQPKAIAVSTGEQVFPERYIYVLNADGTVVVGRFEPNNEKNWIGWLPWSGMGTVKWISSLQSNVMLTSIYPGDVNMVETVDDTTYLDGSVLVNAVPAGMAPAPGKGPLWWLPGLVADLMDGTKPLGSHNVDADGFIIPLEGEDLTSATLTGGLAWTQVLEPFVPHVAGGQDVHQRVTKRRIARAAASIQHATGFAWVKFYSGPSGANLPAPGLMTFARRVTSYDVGDDATAAPPLREVTDTFRPLGRASDPRIGIYKDTPGPIRVLELGMEVTV